MPSFLFSEEIILVILICEVIFRPAVPAQRCSVRQLLQVVQPAGDAAVPVAATLFYSQLSGFSLADSCCSEYNEYTFLNADAGKCD